MGIGRRLREGFARLTQSALADEAAGAEARDDQDPDRRGSQDNVTSHYSDGGNNLEGYTVKEERRGGFWSRIFRGSFDNTSIQEVGYYQKEEHGYASLRSTLEYRRYGNYQYAHGTLRARDDGRVTIRYIGFPYFPSERVGPYGEPLVESANGEFDITDLLAREGITAASIRSMQQRIAYDGEVDRAEQTEIIKLICQAPGC